MALNGPIKPHKEMAMGGGGGSGIPPLPGTGARSMGNTAEQGRHLQDGERANPPPIKIGGGKMRATAHSNHGPHGHFEQY